MAKIDYMDHLDDLLDRIMKEDITSEELDKTIKISKVVVDIANVKLDKEANEISSQKLKVDQFKTLNNLGYVSLELADELKNNVGISNILKK